MSEYQLSQTYHMIQEAAQRGDGYGIDEFHSEQDFRREIAGSDCFAVNVQRKRRTDRWLHTCRSKFYRGAADVVDPFIIVKRTERNQKLGKFCMKKAIEYSKKLAYKGMYVDTFSNNIAVQKILENFGTFVKVGFLPLGGKLQDGQLVGSLIYYMDLTAS
ncbi:hypothetical protein FSP39_016245 [Pinctada imbricata]|uniref:N-acetyltransferase domain-containing protein n=1 Tax=Pinctada imbricata TaxID=66713 RepID=A0AA89BUV8_PINIB|nr:hypothetical protein FSP39_016245 [Pinctada imbricata]